MRGFDCSHPAHEDMHLSGKDDEELIQNTLQHRDQYHPELDDAAIRDIVTTNARDE